MVFTGILTVFASDERPTLPIFVAPERNIFPVDACPLAGRRNLHVPDVDGVAGRRADNRVQFEAQVIPVLHGTHGPIPQWEQCVGGEIAARVGEQTLQAA